jgi:hypothetical protein
MALNLNTTHRSLSSLYWPYIAIIESNSTGARFASLSSSNLYIGYCDVLSFPLRRCRQHLFIISGVYMKIGEETFGQDAYDTFLFHHPEYIDGMLRFIYPIDSWLRFPSYFS